MILAVTRYLVSQGTLLSFVGLLTSTELTFMDQYTWDTSWLLNRLSQSRSLASRRMDLAWTTFITCSAPNLQEEFSSCSIIQSEAAIWKHTSIKPDHNQITREDETGNLFSNILAIVCISVFAGPRTSKLLAPIIRPLNDAIAYGLQKAKYRDVREHQRKVIAK